MQQRLSLVLPAKMRKKLQPVKNIRKFPASAQRLHPPPPPVAAGEPLHPAAPSHGFIPGEVWCTHRGEERRGEERRGERAAAPPAGRVRQRRQGIRVLALLLKTGQKTEISVGKLTAISSRTSTEPLKMANDVYSPTTVSNPKSSCWLGAESKYLGKVRFFLKILET
ncbi:hypothetical protein CHARACLAT_028188, partial [Characodon lateralis]|nr:hypothetical protein [Characodon lateralis]